MRLGATGCRPATQTTSDQKVTIIATEKTQQCNHHQVPGTQEAAQIQNKKSKMPGAHLDKTDARQREKGANVKLLREIVFVAQAQNPIFVAVLIGSRPRTSEPACPNVNWKKYMMTGRHQNRGQAVFPSLFMTGHALYMLQTYCFSFVIAIRMYYGIRHDCDDPKPSTLNLRERWMLKYSEYDEREPSQTRFKPRNASTNEKMIAMTLNPKFA
jgi:hypothetical protein